MTRDDQRREVWRQVITDAIAWRLQDSELSCPACDADPGSLCARHELDMAQVDSYERLARELGIELDH